MSPSQFTIYLVHNNIDSTQRRFSNLNFWANGHSECDEGKFLHPSSAVFNVNTCGSSDYFQSILHRVIWDVLIAPQDFLSPTYPHSWTYSINFFLLSNFSSYWKKQNHKLSFPISIKKTWPSLCVVILWRLNSAPSKTGERENKKSSNIVARRCLDENSPISRIVRRVNVKWAVRERAEKNRGKKVKRTRVELGKFTWWKIGRKNFSPPLRLFPAEL